ncbi:DNA-directed RNA polymerase subunit RPC12/RpoP [Methanohalophilus levihalophilus]|nr:hypothetical protein [Methanohalophilus levihalophilus]MBP2030865.1 DNA-directed RNA polymerase subunit RPC12/RpoP [Methanohalophilus levihalophilus]
MIYHTGDTPGKGTYMCTFCKKEVVLENDTDKLPPCPKCYKTEYTKVE